MKIELGDLHKLLSRKFGFTTNRKSASHFLKTVHHTNTNSKIQLSGSIRDENSVYAPVSCYNVSNFDFRFLIRPSYGNYFASRNDLDVYTGGH
jgi:hypothetical protein